MCHLFIYKPHRFINRIASDLVKKLRFIHRILRYTMTGFVSYYTDYWASYGKPYTTGNIVVEYILVVSRQSVKFRLRNRACLKPSMHFVH